jgi:CRISPR-associated protein Cas6
MMGATHPEARGAVQSESTVDLRFELRGTRLPADYACGLANAVLPRLPWLADDPGSGIHPVRCAPMGDGALGLSRRTRLVLRVPRARAREALALEGCSLAFDGVTLAVGAAKSWPVTASPTLYARRVIMGPEEEVAFATALGDLLRAMEIDCKVVLGRRSALAIPRGERSGFSVLLYGIAPEKSLRLQERGLGVHRVYGCGIMVPHKSVAAVSDWPAAA